MKIERQKYSMDEVYNWDNYIKQGHSIIDASSHFNIPYKSMLNLFNTHLKLINKPIISPIAALIQLFIASQIPESG